MSLSNDDSPHPSLRIIRVSLPGNPSTPFPVISAASMADWMIGVSRLIRRGKLVPEDDISKLGKPDICILDLQEKLSVRNYVNSQVAARAIAANASLTSTWLHSARLSRL